MSNPINIAKTLKIREHGLDEKWLQERIESDPNILGLPGSLRVVERERLQSSGGKIDFLLEDTDDRAMYEVEVMLGQTDEAHIIRTIEYWDLERRRWPKRRHTAVLVAESINRRFFNVVQLLSESVPMVAIKVSLIEVNGEPSLHFTTVLDHYQEPDGNTSVTNVEKGEIWWQNKAPWTLAVAQTFLQLTSSLFTDPKLTFKEDYIRLLERDKFRFAFGGKRPSSQSTVYFYPRNEDVPKVKEALEGGGFTVKFDPSTRTCKEASVKLDSESVERERKVFQEIARLVKDPEKNDR